MGFKKYILIILTIIFYSCDNNISSDITQNNEDTLKNYIQKTLYPNGELKSTVEFINGKKNGNYISYYYTDSIKNNLLGVHERAYYNEGTLNCLYKNYYKNGEPKEETLFLNDTGIVINKFVLDSKTNHTIKGTYLVNTKENGYLFLGSLVFDTLNQIVKNESSYFYCNSPDTVNQNKEFCFVIKQYADISNFISFKLYLGNIRLSDSINIVLTDTQDVFDGKKENNFEIKGCIENNNIGYNLITGKLELKSYDKNNNIVLNEYPFFTDYYVIEKP